jgi:hypothetical protein
MRAFEVHVNGERLCLAGVGEDGVLTAIVDYAGRDKERLHLHVGGLLIPEEQHVKWQDRYLNVGDEVRIRIVESVKVDVPAKRFPKNPKKEIRSQKKYVRMMAKQFGWTIQTARKRT